MTVVTIKGVPKSINVVRFSFFLRINILRKKKAQFLVTRTFSDFHVLFKSEEDAHIVNKTLQNFEFKHKDDTYILEAYIDYDPSILNLEAFTKADNNFGDRKRSPSPKYELNGSSDNIEEVNKAIELTRRKRILLEEERKLLLEQKKISLIKALNPTSIKELENLDKICDHASSNTIENMLAKAQTDPQALGKDKERMTQGQKIYRIRQKIFQQMTKPFNSHVSSKNRYVMKKNVFSILTSRIQSLLKDKPDITKQELFNLYRKIYPVKDDIDFILGLVKHANEMEGDKLNNSQTVSHESENRSISELAEFQVDMENDLDDWLDDDSSKKEPDVQSVPQEQP